MKAVTDSLRDMFEGPERNPETRIAFAVFFAGVGRAAIDPSLADIDDDVLRRTLLDLSNRLMQAVDDNV